MKLCRLRWSGILFDAGARIGYAKASRVREFICRLAELCAFPCGKDHVRVENVRVLEFEVFTLPYY